MREGFRALVSALRRRAVSLASTAGWTAAAGRSEDSPALSAPTAPPGAISALLAELTRPPVGPDMDEVREPRTGDRLGRFLLVSELGHGGFGVVWEARDEMLGRMVALKVLAPARARSEYAARWLMEEAEAAAQLQHTNIVSVFDIGSSEGVPYLVTELLRGETLARRLRRGPLAPGQALRVALQITRGLAHAHSRGVLHLDLKPANVFLSEGGLVKVLDFGLARLFGGASTRGGGTRGYMPPEQLRGEPEDERTDLFALGVLMHEMLWGALPGPQPRVRPLHGLGRRLDAIATRLRSPDAHKRHPNAATLLKELEQLEARSRAAWRGSATALAALVIAALFAGILLRRTTSASPLAAHSFHPTVVIADADNATGDPDLDAWSGLLISALEHSKDVEVATRVRLFDLARYLGRTDVRRIDEALGRDIAGAVHAIALLLPRVTSADGAWSIALRAVDPAKDRTILEIEERAVRKEAIPEAVDRLAARVRVELPLRAAAGDSGNVTASAVAQSMRAYAHYFRGQHVLAQSANLASAAAEFQQALSLDPDFALAHVQLGLLTLQGAPARRRTDQHLTEAFRRLERLPDKERRLVLAWSAHEHGRNDEARSLYRNALASYPYDKDVAWLAGRFSVEEDDLSTGTARLERALGLDPAFHPALLLLLVPYDVLDRNADALAAARRAVAARPDALSYSVLAQAHAYNDQREEAMAAVKRVRELERPPIFQVSHAIAYVLAWNGSWAEAENELQRWTGSNGPEWGVSNFSLGLMMAAQGRVANVRGIADALSDRSRWQNPEEPNFLRGAAAQLAGDRKEAARSFKATGLPRWAPHVAYAGDLEGAAELASRLAPSSRFRASYEATRAWRLGDRETAVSRYLTLLSRERMPTGSLYLAEVLGEMGRDREAVEAFSSFLRSYPGGRGPARLAFQPAALLGLASAQERLGRRAEARATLERLLADWKHADPGLPLLAQAGALQSLLAESE